MPTIIDTVHLSLQAAPMNLTVAASRMARDASASCAPRLGP
jgi:hypothetical protein